MSYQILPIVKAVKDGLVDLDSKRAVWVDATHKQGLKFLNDGKTILIAKSAEDAAEGNATWDTVSHHTAPYSVLLEKKGASPDDEDGSIHLQFTPAAGLTVQTLQDAIDTADGGNLDPVWSFWREEKSAAAANFVQFELRFEDPLSEGWIEITLLPRQGSVAGVGGWVNEIITDTCRYGYGGHTPNGTSVFEWAGALGILDTMLTDVNNIWTAKEQGEAVTTYVLTRVRLELWEAAPARTCGIDDVKINDVTYAVEPGLAGAEIGPNTYISTLEFVEVPDRYGRTEVLAPILGAKQELIVGPLLPVLFNDSAGYTRFKPMQIVPPATEAVAAIGVNFKYIAIQVTNPS